MVSSLMLLLSRDIMPGISAASIEGDMMMARDEPGTIIT